MANVWCRWADDKLVKLLPVNLYRSLSDSILVFNNISRSWTPWQRFFFRYPGAVALSFAQKKMKKRAGLKPDANERHALMDEISLWEDAVAGGPFNGGSRPLLSDMLVYGYLRTVISYPLGQELLSRPRLAHWFVSLTRAQVPQRRGLPGPGSPRGSGHHSGTGPLRIAATRTPQDAPPLESTPVGE